MPEEGQVEYYNVRPEQFERQLHFLRRNGFDVLTLEEIITCREQGIHIRRPVVITFHDGFQDNYVNAFSILKKFGFTATFFVASDYIDGDEPFRWLVWDENARAHYRNNRSLWLPLTSEQMVEMSAAGMEFGSHSRTHHPLAALTDDEAEDEIRGSKEKLEGLLGRPVYSFAFPFGLWGDIKQRHVDLVKEAGYKTALTARIDRNNLEGNYYDLGVIPVYEGDSLWEFKKKVEGAYDWMRFFQPLWIKAFPKKRDNHRYESR